MKRFLLSMAAAGGLLASGGVVKADTVLDITVENFIATSADANNDGVIELSFDNDIVQNDTKVKTINVDDIEKLTSPVVVGDFSGDFLISGSGVGSTVSGSLFLTDDDGDVLQILNATGVVQNEGLLYYEIVVETHNSLFDPGATEFFGVNVEAWDENEPFYTLTSTFRLNKTVLTDFITDDAAGASITAVVPVPMAAWGGMALCGMLGIGKLRRRSVAAE